VSVNVLRELARDLAMYGYKVSVSNGSAVIVSDGVNKYVLRVVAYKHSRRYVSISVNGAEIAKVKSIKSGILTFRAMLLRDIVYHTDNWGLQGKPGMTVTTIRLPNALMQAIERMVKAGIFANRSEAIRALLLAGFRFYLPLLAP